MEQSIIGRDCLFWPKFYYCLFKTDKNRWKIWEIISSPVPPDSRKASKQSNRIPLFECNVELLLILSGSGGVHPPQPETRKRSRQGSCRRNHPHILQWSTALGSSICIYFGNSARAARRPAQINLIYYTYTYSIPVSNLKGPYTPLEKIIDSIYVSTYVANIAHKNVCNSCGPQRESFLLGYRWNNFCRG